MTELGRSANLNEDFFLENVGGYGLKAILLEKGWTNDEIMSQVQELIDAHEPVVRFMNSDGNDNYEALPPNWRPKMVVLTALRMLVDTAGVNFMSINRRIEWEAEGYQVNDLRMDRPLNVTLKDPEKPDVADEDRGPVTYR